MALRPLRIVVFGSMVADLVVWAPRRPLPGETLIGSRFDTFLGGKGFNQCVAAARLGAAASMIGAVGSDDLGDAFFNAMEEEGIDASGVVSVEGRTGVGLPLVEDGGLVSIVGVPGVNELLTPTHADAAAAVLASADACIVQCEVPADASLRALELAPSALKVLNAAPAGDRARAVSRQADVVIVNEPELAELVGARVEDVADPSFALDAARHLRRDTGATTVVATLASRGAVLAGSDGDLEIGGHAVDALDATGAGDAFTAALAVSLARGDSEASALALANASGAVAVGVAGAYPSMPDEAAVESALAARGAPEVSILGGRGDARGSDAGG